MRELPFIVYVIAILAGALFAAALAYAPMKLYGIHRELRRQNETLAVHTKLLASIANALNPAEARHE